MTIILISLLSALLGFMILVYIRRYDIWEPEPLHKLLVVTLTGGLLAFGLALILYRVAGWFIPHDSSNTIIRSYLVIGPVEELSKLASFLILYFMMFHRHIDEPIDAIIYMSSIALGFSLYENVLYSQQYGASVIVFRYFVASPAHILFSVPMALPAEAMLNRAAGKTQLIKFWMLSSLLHGTWDVLVYHRTFAFLFAVLLFIMFSLAKNRISRGLLSSQYYPDIRDFFSHGTAGDTEDVYCVKCRDDRTLPVIDNGGIEYYHCGNCGSTIVSRDMAFRIIRLFFATFEDLTKEYLPSRNDNQLYTIRECVYIDDEQDFGILDIDELVSRTDEKRFDASYRE